MTKLAALLLAAGIVATADVGMAGGAERSSMTDSIIGRIEGLDAEGIQAFRAGVIENGRNDDFVVLLGMLDSAGRARLLDGLGPATVVRVEQMMAEQGETGPDRQAAAAASLAGLLEPAELAYYRALVLYQQKKYAEAARLCEDAFRLGAGRQDRYYNAACASALAGDRDGAFRLLGQAADEGWLAVDATEEDEDLAGLHDDPRWQQLLGRMKKAVEERLATLPDKHSPLETVKLPGPALKGAVSVEEALSRRRSVRQYGQEHLTLKGVGQLLWAAYGVTQPIPKAPEWLRGGLKTAPSAGALYPLELYLVAGSVEGLEPGVYWYGPEAHELRLVARGDRRGELFDASAGQTWVRDAPASIVYSAVFSRNTAKYGKRGRERYVCMDLGHSGENVYLQCASLGLGTVAIGAFHDADVKLAVGMTREEEPLYIMPVGRLPKEK